MSIKSKPYYWVACDRCGDDAEYGDWSAMADPGQAVDVLDDDWLTVNGINGELHYCPDCTIWSEDEDCFVVAPEANPDVLVVSPREGTQQ